MALSRLLDERSDMLRDKNVIVFAFDAPYYLDSSQVAQLTAYYALYNRTSAAVDMAARILFQEFTPAGNSPVSIDAIGYSLIYVTQPDPNQAIELTYDVPAIEGATPTPVDSTPEPARGVVLNDTVTFRTSVIRDRNGNPVPDGTPVKFWANYSLTEGFKELFADTTTVDGIASAQLLLNRLGNVDVSVTSEPAISELFILKFTVGPDPSTPEPIIASPAPTDTPSPTTEPSSTPTPVVTVTPAVTGELSSSPVSGLDLLLTAITLAVMGAAAWRVTNSRVDAVSDGVKLFLVIAIGAFLAYDYYALKLPGWKTVSALGVWAVPMMVWTGGLIGFGLGWWWLRRANGLSAGRKNKQPHA
jgi:beta-N-acetylhexosaminidase